MWLLAALACDPEPARRRPPPPTDTETAGSTPSTPNCHGVVDTIDLPGRITPSIGLSAELAEPGPAHVVCTAADDPEDRLLVRSAASADRHDLVVLGLRPDTDYTCDVYADCGGPRRTFVHHTAIPDDVPRLTAETAPGASPTGAYTLFNTQRGCFAGAPATLVIVDPEGRVRWSYRVGTDLVCDLDATVIPPDRVHVGGGWGVFDEGQPNRGVFRTIDLAGNVLLERDEPDFGLGFNHHSEPLPDGSYLSSTGTRNTRSSEAFYGVGLEWWDPVDGLRWTWSSQGLVDAGEVEIPPYEDRPFHANAARLVDDARGPGAYVSLYGSREIWRIDRDTGERVWTFGRGGDFALRDAEGAPLGADGFPDVQHDPEYADGSLLVYDNGQDRGFSRVTEYALDEDARVATLRWSFTEPGWWDPICGDADWLPDGRVLITRAFSREWSPGSSDVSQVVELEPPDRVIWRLRWPDGGWNTFRAQRLGGCELFANAKYCPAVAAELDALHP
jgi:hypothetical protein